MNHEDTASLSTIHDGELLKRFKVLIISILLGVIMSVMAFVSIVHQNMDTLERDFVSDKQRSLFLMNNEWQELRFAIKALQQFYLASDDIARKDFDTFIRPYSALPFKYLFAYSETTKQAFTSTDAINNATIESMLLQNTQYIASESINILSQQDEKTRLFLLVRAKSRKNYILGGSVNLQEMLRPLQEDGVTIYIKHNNNASRTLFWKVDSSGVSMIDAIPENIADRFAFSYQHRLALFDDTMSFTFLPDHHIYYQAADALAWSVLATGLCLTTLIGIFLYVIIGRNVKISHYANRLQENRHALEISHIKLEQSNKDLDDFAYIASHDLKEPLRGLHNHAVFLKEDYEDILGEDGIKRINRLMHLTQRMEALINNLLYFSRLGRQELAYKEVHIKDIISDIEDMLDGYIEERHVSIIVQESIPLIFCDKIRVTELFRNLITNAIKYGDKDKTEITVGYCDTRQHNDTVYHNVLFVADNGCGIEEEFFDDIFTIFKQLHNDKSIDSTGSGLTFVKKIIERHQGTIWVESILGAGTSFYFTLHGEHHETTIITA